MDNTEKRTWDHSFLDNSHNNMEAIGTHPYPVISWSGSRCEISQKVRGKFPQDFGTYYDPMIGSASLLLGNRNYSAVIGDKNCWLMDMYWAIKDDYRGVVRILESLTPSREVYDRVRQIDPSNIEVNFRAAHFIFLNRLCFGGIFRVNKQGKFNVPFGKPQSVYTEANLRAVSEVLNGVKLESGDFEETIESAKENDFIYFDPPCPEKRVFGYSRSKGKDPFEFTQKDYLRLTTACINLDKRGVKWAVTDNNTSLIRLSLHKFHVTELVRSKEDNEINVVLITNYPT
jgi:DNA adenine methylase